MEAPVVGRQDLETLPVVLVVEVLQEFGLGVLVDVLETS